MAVAVILRPRGIRGEVKAKIVADPGEFIGNSQMFLEEETAWKPISIARHFFKNDFWFIHIAGVESIEQAELLRGKHIGVKTGDLSPLSEGRYYHAQLIGMAVVDPSGKKLGKVLEVVKHAKIDYLVVEGESQMTVPLSKSLIDSIKINEGKIILKSEFK